MVSVGDENISPHFEMGVKCGNFQCVSINPYLVTHHWNQERSAYYNVNVNNAYRKGFYDSPDLRWWPF